MPSIQPDFHTLRDKIGCETWQVTAQWPDGDITTPEFDPRSRTAAYDAARQAFEDGCAVEVIRIHRNTWTGAPLAVSDYSALFYSETGLDPYRNPIAVPGYGSQCDDAYDARRLEAAE